MTFKSYFIENIWQIISSIGSLASVVMLYFILKPRWKKVNVKLDEFYFDLPSIGKNVVNPFLKCSLIIKNFGRESYFKVQAILFHDNKEIFNKLLWRGILDFKDVKEISYPHIPLQGPLTSEVVLNIFIYTFEKNKQKIRDSYLFRFDNSNGQKYETFRLVNKNELLKNKLKIRHTEKIINYKKWKKGENK